MQLEHSVLVWLHTLLKHGCTVHDWAGAWNALLSYSSLDKIKSLSLRSLGCLPRTANPSWTLPFRPIPVGPADHCADHDDNVDSRYENGSGASDSGTLTNTRQICATSPGQAWSRPAPGQNCSTVDLYSVCLPAVDGKAWISPFVYVAGTRRETWLHHGIAILCD